MMRSRDALTVAIGAAVLFAYYGIAQALPWGIGSVSNFSSTTEETYVASTGSLQQAAPETWVTGSFERDFVGRVSTLATDESFSWIMSVPRSSYDLGAYFAWHALTQMMVAGCLYIGLRLLAPLARARRMRVVAAAATAAALASHGTMMNWVGTSPAYGIGESINLIASWLLACAVMDRVSRRGVATGAHPMASVASR